MALWYARLEHGDEFIDIQMDAKDKEDALRIVARENKTLAALHSRPEYRLKRLKKVQNRFWER